MKCFDKIILTIAFLVFSSFVSFWVKAEYKLGYMEGRESVYSAQHEDFVLPPYTSKEYKGDPTP